MALHLRRPSRRLLLPALVVAVIAAVLSGAAPRPSALHPGHAAHRAAARVPRPQPQPPRPEHVSGPVVAAAKSPPAAVLSIASLRSLHQAATGPILPIGPPQREPGYSLQRVAYHSQGLRVTATLLLPTTPGRHPLVLALHGFSTPRTYRDGGDAMPLAVPLARHGVLVGVPDYRGLGGSAPDPRTEPLPIAAAIDSLNLLELLRTDPRVDPTHIGIVGHSLGGNVGEILLAAHTGIRAAVLYAPSESQDSSLYQRRPSYFEGRPDVGPPAQDPALYRAMSPGSNFAPLRCQVLLEQGTADSIVPPYASVIASRELDAAGASVRLTMVPGADHDLSQAVWDPGLAEGTSFLLQAL